MLLATPNGILAFMDSETGQVAWVAEDLFDSPIAYAVDAASGASVPVSIIPDAAMPHGSTDYLTREIERQVAVLRSEADALLGEDEQTIVGTLPTGQLYAMPIGGVSLSSSTSALTTVQQTLNSGAGGASGNRHQEPKLSSGQPLGRSSCRPGTLSFPACLMGTIERRDPFVRPLEGVLLQGSALPLEDRAVVSFYHPDFGYIPPEHFYTLNQNPNHQKYKKVFRILGSWLLPTIAFLFVVSFELGRRKRENDSKQTDSVATDVVVTDIDAGTGSKSKAGGVIQVYDDVILGYGGHGTIVYKGMLDGRQVAVKRMLKTYHASAGREISLLIESDGHVNVVRYFLKEVRGDFVYLALILCDLSLHDLIATLKNHFDQDHHNSAVPVATKTILYQISCGVQHLHHLRIVHRKSKQELMAAPLEWLDHLHHFTIYRSLSPEDEGVYKIFQQGRYVAKISDMGLGKQLVGQSSCGASLMTNSYLEVSAGRHQKLWRGEFPLIQVCAPTEAIYKAISTLRHHHSKPRPMLGPVGQSIYSLSVAFFTPPVFPDIIRLANGTNESVYRGPSRPLARCT
jgi:serine/threonine protein kinase